MSKLFPIPLINRRDRLGLTLQGWLFGLALVSVVAWGLLSHIHGFFALTQPIELGRVPAEGETIAAMAMGDLTLHGVTRGVSIPLEGQLSNGFAIQMKVGCFLMDTICGRSSWTHCATRLFLFRRAAC